jgi:hypothetical protein
MAVSCGNRSDEGKTKVEIEEVEVGWQPSHDENVGDYNCTCK